MQFTNLNFFSFLIFLILVGLISFLFYIKYINQINFNKKYKLLSSSKNFYIKYIFLILSIFFILLGIFGIKYGENKNSGEVNGIDLMFVLDVSKSMNVADIRDSNYNYTRLDIAKKAIADYVIKHDNNRYGLVIFAGDAISTIPLTSDYNLFLTMLSGVDYRNLTVQGSDFKKALDLAISRFVGDKDRSKALVFISDGGDVGDNVNILDFNRKDIAFAVVGVGTEKGGMIIKGRDAFGRPIFQKYKGDYVISKLNEDNLQEIVEKLKASYFKLNDVYDLDKLDKIFSKLEKKSITLKNTDSLNNFSRNLAIISLIFFLIFIFNNIFTLGKKHSQ